MTKLITWLMRSLLRPAYLTVPLFDRAVTASVQGSTSGTGTERSRGGRRTGHKAAGAHHCGVVR